MVYTGTAAALPTQLKQEAYTKPSKLYDNDYIRADKRMNPVHLINVVIHRWNDCGTSVLVKSLKARHAVLEMKRACTVLYSTLSQVPTRQEPEGGEAIVLRMCRGTR